MKKISCSIQLLVCNVLNYFQNVFFKIWTCFCVINNKSLLVLTWQSWLSMRLQNSYVWNRAITFGAYVHNLCPFGNCSTRTEFLQSPFRTEFRMGSLSRHYWQIPAALPPIPAALLPILAVIGGALLPMWQCRSLRNSLSIVKHLKNILKHIRHHEPVPIMQNWYPLWKKHSLQANMFLCY